LSVNTPEINVYDAVVIGSNIHMGQINKNAKRFMRDNQNELSEKRTAYFFCCGFADKKDEVIARNFPEQYSKNTVAVECFGGEMDINRLRGMDKFIAKMVTKSTAGQGVPAPSIKHDRIEAMAKAIKG
jgi:menaquinone-dependent protoporphyrinogen IX oxidase